MEQKICIFLIILENLCDYGTSYQAMPVKIISTSSFKISIMHAIESKIKLPQEFSRKRNSSVVYRKTCAKIALLLFLTMHTLFINFYAISFSRNRDQLIPKIPEKVLLQRHLLSDFHQRLIELNLC